MMKILSIRRHILLVGLILFQPTWLKAERIETHDLCGILEIIEPGEEVSLVLTGVYGWRWDLLYSPGHHECLLDTQPSTYVEFPEEVKKKYHAEYEKLKKLGSKDGDARVILEGSLQGQKIAKEDEAHLAPRVSYANRAADSRYGFHNWSRTKFVVNAIRSVERIPDVEDLPVGRVHPIHNPPGSLVLNGAELPGYPKFARKIGIQGKVIIQAKIENGLVTDLEVLAGDRMLSEEAVKNMRTWKFPPEINRSISTSFVYRLEPRSPEERHRIEVDFNLPRRVTIVGSVNAW